MIARTACHTLALRCGLAISSALALAACATPPAAPAASVVVVDWQAVALPGKRSTLYRAERKDGRAAVAAWADASASMWRRPVVRASDAIGEVEFSWWVQAVPVNADVSQAEHDDAAARVMFSFAGDTGRLSARNLMLFDLALALTGEAPPFATLMYVWDAKAPVGSVIIHPRSDRIRKIVVESGTSGLRAWRSYRRDLAADYRLAFGEAPGALQALALMTDGDNTQSQLATWYGEVILH
jgi:predicted lipoprotein with Yx(FWY)xxD motif